MSTSVRRTKSGIVAFDSAMRRATTPCSRDGSWITTSPFAVPRSATVPARSGSGAAPARRALPRRGARRRALDVRLHDPPARDRCPRRRAEIDAALSREPPGDGGSDDALAAVVVRLRLGRGLLVGGGLLGCSSASGSSSDSSAPPLPRRLLLGLRLLVLVLGGGLLLLVGGSSSSSSPRLLVVRRALLRRPALELRDDLADGERLPLVGDDLEHAGRIGLVGHRGLVGLDLCELVALGDLVPVGLQPLQDRALLHGVGQPRHRDLGHRRRTLSRSLGVHVTCQKVRTRSIRSARAPPPRARARRRRGTPRRPPRPPVRSRTPRSRASAVARVSRRGRPTASWRPAAARADGSRTRRRRSRTLSCTDRSRPAA